MSLAALNWLVEKAEPILVTYPRLLLLPFRCILDLNGESGESNTRLCVALIASCKRFSFLSSICLRTAI